MLKFLKTMAKAVGSLIQTIAEGAAHLAYAASMICYMAVNLVTVAADVIHQLTILTLQGMRGFGQMLGLIPLDDPQPPARPQAPTPEEIKGESHREKIPAVYDFLTRDMAQTVQAFASASHRERTMMDLGSLGEREMMWLFALDDKQLDSVARAPLSEVERALPTMDEVYAEAAAPRDADEVRDEVRSDRDLDYTYAPAPRPAFA